MNKWKMFSSVEQTLCVSIFFLYFSLLSHTTSLTGTNIHLNTKTTISIRWVLLFYNVFPSKHHTNIFLDFFFVTPKVSTIKIFLWIFGWHYYTRDILSIIMLCVVLLVPRDYYLVCLVQSEKYSFFFFLYRKVYI